MGFFNWLTGKPAAPLTAQQYLAAVQRKSPPIPTPDIPQDYGQQLYSGLERRLPDEVRQLFDQGIIAIGEVGILTPGVYVDSVSPAGYAIQIHTGLPRFLFRVSRALCTRVRVFSGQGGSNVQEVTAEFEETTTVVAKIFRNFMDKGIVAGPSGYSVTEEQKGIASALASHAETFLVAHEIGHVMVWRGQGGEPQTLSHNDEFEADRYALEFVLGLRGQPGAMNGLSQRMVYAGMEFALRVYAGLEHLEYTFEKTHPLADRRIEHIRSIAVQHFGRRGFMKLSTIAFGYDQLLEAVERKLARPGAAAKFVLGFTPERVLSGLSVLVEQCAKGMITTEFAISELSKFFAEAPEPVMQAAAKEAVTMYFLDPLPDGTSDQILFDQMQREMFREIIQDLPEVLRKVFVDAYSAVTDVRSNNGKGNGSI